MTQISTAELECQDGGGRRAEYISLAMTNHLLPTGDKNRRTQINAHRCRLTKAKFWGIQL
jgi:hypothetical protein